jgi:aconitate hydratase 2/2-methylisocitrate dehydratase
MCNHASAHVREGATVVSTSTRNFPNRLGKNTSVFLASADGEAPEASA